MITLPPTASNRACPLMRIGGTNFKESELNSIIKIAIKN